VPERVPANRGGDARGLGVAGEALADAAVAVGFFQLDSNRYAAPARRWSAMCGATVSLKAAGKGTARFLPPALGDPDAACIKVDAGDPDPDELEEEPAPVRQQRRMSISSWDSTVSNSERGTGIETAGWPLVTWP
jgi:hypothetical protein